MDIISLMPSCESFKRALPTSTPDKSFSKIHVLSTKFCRRLPFLTEASVPFSYMTTGALFRFFREEATVCQDPASFSSISSSSESNGVASIHSCPRRASTREHHMWPIAGSGRHRTGSFRRSTTQGALRAFPFLSIPRSRIIVSRFTTPAEAFHSYRPAKFREAIRARPLPRHVLTRPTTKP